MTILDDIAQAIQAEGLDLEQSVKAFARQLRSGHGRQVLVGNHVENVVEESIRSVAGVVEYVVGDEKIGAGDHHVRLVRAPDIWITVESKTGTHESYDVRRAKRRPGGRVKVNVCRSRLKGIDRYYPVRGSFRVMSTAFLLNGSWYVKAILTSKLPRSQRYSEMLQPGQTFQLDEPGEWGNLDEVLDKALDEALAERFITKSSTWLKRSH